MSKRIATILALLVVAIPFLSACGTDNSAATPIANTTVPATSAPANCKLSGSHGPRAMLWAS